MNTNNMNGTSSSSPFLNVFTADDTTSTEIITNRMIYDKLLEIQAAVQNPQSLPPSSVAGNQQGANLVTRHHCSCCILRRGGNILGLDAPVSLGIDVFDKNAFSILAGDLTAQELKHLLDTLNDGGRTFESVSAKSEKAECVSMTVEALRRNFRWMHQPEEVILEEANRRFEVTYYYCKVFVRFHLSGDKEFRWMDLSRGDQNKYIVAFEEMMRRITSSDDVSVTVNDVIPLNVCKKGWAARNLLRYSIRNLHRKAVTGTSNNVPPVTGRRNRAPSHKQRVIIITLSR
ncbi:hypothetical protein BDF20DRAFT_1004055 [Mycotypha africana]|uniref:uncharacterized protein n=1 Tax=Mycotypha africana TaxID=64632 RepID=UPI0023012B53|nr:uncharacterized protein BDF20DRAFT_1004055 [Mycotypha africana]KAI8969355.1 hypothetical protein BDF20DRAFT_1004055 [Mycotypha africana]